VDLLFDADGSVRRFVVEGTEGDEEIPADDAVALLGGATASAV
jgi:hypothetical protein